MDTLYGTMEDSLFEQFKRIKLLVCDVDGVFSDGSIYMGNQGEELKAFNTKDGYGVKAIQALGITVAIITGRKSHIVQQRMTSLGVEHIIQGEEDKATAIAALINQLNLTESQVASVGDDMPDVGMFKHSLIGIAPADAHPYVKNQANYITQVDGGKGAVREICDIMLQAHGCVEGILSSST